MGMASELRPEMSVTDLAFTILKNHGKPMHFKELITEVMRVKAIGPENPGRLIAQMHTEINLDSRFVHQGNGEWGLRDWQPKGSKVVKIRPETSAPAAKGRKGKRKAADDDDYGYEEEEEQEESDDDLLMEGDDFEDDLSGDDRSDDEPDGDE